MEITEELHIGTLHHAWEIRAKESFFLWTYFCFKSPIFLSFFEVYLKELSDPQKFLTAVSLLCMA